MKITENFKEYSMIGSYDDLFFFRKELLWYWKVKILLKREYTRNDNTISLLMTDVSENGIYSYQDFILVPWFRKVINSLCILYIRYHDVLDYLLFHGISKHKYTLLKKGLH